MKMLLKLTREIYHCFTDGNGNILDRPVGTIAKRRLIKEQEDFLKRYLDLIINSKIVSKTTKLYISSTLPSVESVINNYNQTVDEIDRINTNTARSQIYYDTKKMERYFQDDMLTKIIATRACDLKEYNKRLNLAITDYSRKNKVLADNLILKLHCTEVKGTCTDDEFMELMNILSPYFRSTIKYVESNLPSSVGYLLYLMSTPTSSLTFEDKERVKLIKLMLE